MPPSASSTACSSSPTIPSSASRATRDPAIDSTRPPQPAGRISPHPLVRTHPESGRTLPYLGAATEIAGWEPRESVALIERSLAHPLDPRLAYRHRRRVGGIVCRDDQAAVLVRTPFPVESRRVRKRTGLAGGWPL
ncbi:MULTISPECIES: TauD/TfdA family dioxygenase [unclassified Methylococcus]|uniref:TauD/TfdA family dioxygenase n=1 Tax=unclassified Methylococcus TaxID=2618889 RepID=UPI003D7C9A4F